MTSTVGLRPALWVAGLYSVIVGFILLFPSISVTVFGRPVIDPAVAAGWGTSLIATGILALGVKVPLVPVYLQGTFDVWPRGERWPRPGAVRVTFGEPASVDDLLRDPAAVGADEPERLMAALRARVVALAGPVAPGKGLA